MRETEASDDFEALALDWMFSVVKSLIGVLREAGVSDADVQRKVCESFFFQLGVALDGGEVRSEPAPRAILCFEHDGRLLRATDMFDFHDYTLGVVGEAFGDP